MGTIGTPPLRTVKLGMIDFSNTAYRISRPMRDDTLRRSISRFGILVPPTLVEAEKSYVIAAGHNRLEAVRVLGAESVESTVLLEMSREAFMRYALEKAFGNALGPIGRIRSVVILRSLGADERTVERAAVSGMGIPAEILRDEAFIPGILALPLPLLRYLDMRDIGFKSLKALIRLPGEGLDFLARWVDENYLRLNIFRDAVEMLIDIRRRDGSLSRVLETVPRRGANVHAEEDRLHEALFRIRYPEYSRTMSRAESLQEEYRGRGISFVLPPYLEGDTIEARISFGRRDTPERIASALGKIVPADIRRLLELLS